jgi:hypothetical protein
MNDELAVEVTQSSQDLPKVFRSLRFLDPLVGDNIIEEFSSFCEFEHQAGES